MHSAPAVSFPVGRSRFQVMFLALTWLLGIVVCVYWSAVVEATGWRQAIMFVVSLVGSLCAFWQLKHLPKGALTWEGQHWMLKLAPNEPMTTPPQAYEGDVALYLDLQFFMLLGFHDLAHRTTWLWLDRSASQTHWLALRRALHGSVRGSL